MRTLLIVPDLFHAEGGIARIMRLYLKAVGELSAPGDKVRYVALIDQGDTMARARAVAGERLAGLDNCSRRKWLFFLTVLWRGQKTDRIICGHLHHLILARFAAILRPGLKYFLVAHGIEVWRPYTLLERAGLRAADRIFCVSEYTRRQMLRFAPFLDPARLVVVPNTFDPDFRERVVPEDGELPDKTYSLSEDVVGNASQQPTTSSHNAEAGGPSPRILVVSRLVSTDPYKGVDTMIEAMPEVLRQFPTAQLRIVGGGDDRPRLEGIATTLGLGRAVHFNGIIDDAVLRQEYLACDLFALPSRKEGFGLVYLEAMTYGKPCLAARAGGAPEVVTPDVGVLVEYGNVHQIATSVADLMSHRRDPARARKRAAEFSFPVFAERVIRMLQSNS